MKRTKNITHMIRDRRIEKWVSDNSKFSTYFSYIQTQDIKSTGAKSRMPDYSKDNQDRDFISTNESLMFLHLLYDQRITSIREQYPLLPIERAQYVAKKLGIRYPTYPYSASVPVVMTVDFYCETVFDRDVVYSIKDSKELDKKRTEDKQKIEKLFVTTQRKPTAWHLITDTQLKTILGSNLEKIAPYMRLDDYLLPAYSGWLKTMSFLCSRYQEDSCANVLIRSSELSGIDYDSAVTCFQYALWHRDIHANLRVPLHYNKTLSELKVRVNEL